MEEVLILDQVLVNESGVLDGGGLLIDLMISELLPGLLPSLLVETVKARGDFLLLVVVSPGEGGLGGDLLVLEGVVFLLGS